jgi:hypothetical protein
MGLILRDLGHDGRQFDALKTFRLGIVRPGLARQRFGAVCTVLGKEVLPVRDTFGRQQLFQVRRVIRLSAASVFRLRLVDGLGGTERIGGGRSRRVAGIGVELGQQLLLLGKKLTHQRLQLGHAGCEGTTSWTRRFRHARQLTKSSFWQLRQLWRR